MKIIDLQLTATKHILILLLLICMVITRTDCFAVETLAIEATGLKDANLTGRVIGTTGNKLFVAGGLTVDDTWCDTINYLEKNIDGSYVWRESPVRLPVALSSAGTFSSSDGLYIVGGLTREGPSDFCCILFWNKENSKLETKVLPRLPIPLVSPAVALVDQTLYVVGGFTDAECKIPSDTFFAIKAGQSTVTANTWRKLPVLPMGARGGAVTAVQNHEAGKALFLFGGQALNDQSEVAPQSDGWYYLPVKESWFPVMEEDNKPFDHYVNAAVATGTTHILFPGHVGFKGNFSEGQDQSSTATKRNIYAYNTITKKFFLQDAAERDLPAEATPVRWDNAIVLVAKSWGGEQSQSNILRLQIYQQKNNLGTLNILVMVVYFGLLGVDGLLLCEETERHRRLLSRGPSCSLVDRWNKYLWNDHECHIVHGGSG
ncbi:MAG: hypothetical protein Q4G68_06005 [Planctomycetia bacterium]|nr:hypothetical protein [Planctomycetia bacterium]